MLTSEASSPLPLAGAAPPGRAPNTEHAAKKRLGTAARVVLLGALLVLIAAVAWRAALAGRSAPPQYLTGAVDRGPVAAKVTANGTLSALVTVSVGTQVSGRIDSLGADFGSRVTRGQVIATIEPSLFRATAAQAKANHTAARAALERASAQLVGAVRQSQRSAALRAEGLMTGADFDAAEAALGVARADVRVAEANIAQAAAARDQAELNLRYTTIVSPIDGTVLSRNVDVGQTVAATLQAPTLFTIAQDLTRMQVDTNVAEADVGKIRPGLGVSFSVDSYPGRSFPGTVRQLRDNAQTLQNVVTYDAVVDVDNSELLLKPGMTASVTFIYDARPDALRVPNAALRFQPDATALALMQASEPPAPAPRTRTLWLLRGGHATAVTVRTGLTDGTLTEVLDGDVRAGELAIVEVLAEGSGHGR